MRRRLAATACPTLATARGYLGPAPSAVLAQRIDDALHVCADHASTVSAPLPGSPNEPVYSSTTSIGPTSAASDWANWLLAVVSTKIAWSSPLGTDT